MRNVLCRTWLLDSRWLILLNSTSVRDHHFNWARLYHLLFRFTIAVHGVARRTESKELIDHCECFAKRNIVLIERVKGQAQSETWIKVMQFALRVNSAKHGVKCKSFRKLRKCVRSSFEGNTYVCPEYGKVDSCKCRRLQKTTEDHKESRRSRKAQRRQICPDC